MNVWRLITHHADPEAVVAWSQMKSRIAIGWGGVGNIREKGYTSAKEIANTTRHLHPALHNAPYSGAQLWNFCYNMKPGDLVILSTGKYRALVMQVQGDYEHVSSEQAPLFGDYQHQRTATVTSIAPNELWRLAGSHPAPSQSIRWTLIFCQNSVEASEL